MKNAPTVLIVEDNDMNRKLFRDILHAHGYKTVEASDGVEAIEMASKEEPDLIVLDIQLPKVSGLEVLSWLKNDEKLRTIPVISVTAFAMKGDEAKLRAYGCEAYIPKPITISRFMKTIEKFSPAPLKRAV